MMTNRREFLRLSAVAAAAAPVLAVRGGAISAAPTPSAVAAVMFSALPHVQLLGGDSVGIAWMTAVRATGRVTWSQDGWEPKLKRLDALNEVWKTANITLMMGAHLHWWCWSDPWEGRPYPLVVGGGPYLGSPAKHNNATLTKCHLEENCLSVKVLDQTGKAVITKEIALS